MQKNVKLEVEAIIKYFNLNCTAEEFPQKANWYDISEKCQLSDRIG